MEVESANLLVVDDDPELRELTQAYLNQQGFQVACVESGEAMDAYLQDHAVDLIILDLMLPGEHGLSIAQRLKKHSAIPIIIVSAPIVVVSAIVIVLIVVVVVIVVVVLIVSSSSIVVVAIVVLPIVLIVVVVACFYSNSMF